MDINSLLNNESNFQESVILKTPQKQYTPCITRSDRIRIKTALDFNIPWEKIHKKYGYTNRQID